MKPLRRCLPELGRERYAADGVGMNAAQIFQEKMKRDRRAGTDIDAVGIVMRKVDTEAQAFIDISQNEARGAGTRLRIESLCVRAR